MLVLWRVSSSAANAVLVERDRSGCHVGETAVGIACYFKVLAAAVRASHALGHVGYDDTVRQ